VQSGAVATISGSTFERNRSQAIRVAGTGTTLRFFGGRVRDTNSSGRDRVEGWGLGVVDRALAELRGVTFARNREVGIFVQGPETSLLLEDSRVANTLSRDRDSTLGRGLDAEGGASVVVRRTVLDRNFDVSLFAHGEQTSVLLEDVVVRDTQSRIADGAYGRGIDIASGARLEARRVVLVGNRDFGLLVTSSAAASLSDVRIFDTRSPSCEGCAANASAIGSVGSGWVDGERIVARGAAGCGVLAEGCASLDLDDTLLVGHATGACLEASTPAACLEGAGPVYWGNDSDTATSWPTAWERAQPLRSRPDR